MNQDIIKHRELLNKKRSELDLLEKELERKEKNVNEFQEAINNFDNSDFIAKLIEEIEHSIWKYWNWTGKFKNTHIQDYKVIILYHNKDGIYVLHVIPKQNWLTPVIEKYFHKLEDCIDYIKFLCINGINADNHLQSILDY